MTTNVHHLHWYQLRRRSTSRKAFAWRIVERIFHDQELNDHNVSGKKGKDELDVNKLQMVYNIVFNHWPLERDERDIDNIWKEVCKSIDGRIRMKFKTANS